LISAICTRSLIDLLDSVEHDHGIDAAVDELSEAAAQYLEEVERAAAMQTEAGDRALDRRFKNITRAFAELRTALAKAKPKATTPSGVNCAASGSFGYAVTIDIAEH
jgi:hypothetical protein